VKEQKRRGDKRAGSYLAFRWGDNLIKKRVSRAQKWGEARLREAGGEEGDREKAPEKGPKGERCTSGSTSQWEENVDSRKPPRGRTPGCDENLRGNLESRDILKKSLPN